jgi:hypothetical protein
MCPLKLYLDPEGLEQVVLRKPDPRLPCCDCKPGEA